MTRPGIVVTPTDSAIPRTTSTDSGTWFVAGLTEQGTLEPTLVKSLNQYVDVFGARVAYGALYDALDVFFREGGARAIVGRVVGPDAVASSAVLYDAAGSTPADVALDVSAKNPGAWGDELNVEVTAGDAVDEFKILVSHDTLGLLETSPSLLDRDAAVAWADTTSAYIDIALGASNEDPRVQGPTGLAGGDDDRANITDDEWAATLALFTRDLGAGQVSMPGRTTLQAHSDTLAHAAAFARTALLDAPDTGVADDLIDAATDIRALGSVARYGGLFAPYATVPGLTPSTTRSVGYAAVQAGLMARNDGAGLSVNQPAAGELGVSRYALAVSQSFTEAERESLNDAGVNLARLLYGSIRTYGYRTLADPLADANWINLANTRLLNDITSKAYAIGERYMFRQLDARKVTISQWGGDLRAMLMPYFEAGSLYGESPDEAFSVDVGDTINTPVTIANNELRAALSVRMSAMAELVTIEIIKVPTNEEIA